MKFDEYLAGKKIDAKQFKDGAPGQYNEFKSIFDQVHPDSFTQQKLFFINKIRRSFRLKEEAEVKKTSPETKAMRPKMKPLKPKTS